MPWNRSTGYFVRAESWPIFDQIGLPALASPGPTCLTSTGHQTGGSGTKVSSTRCRKICVNTALQHAP